MAARICELAAQGQTVPQISRSLGLDYHNTRSVLRYRRVDPPLAQKRWHDAAWPEVKRLILAGHTRPEIAAHLGIDVRTLKTHLEKLEIFPLQPRSEYIRRVLARGLTKAPSSPPVIGKVVSREHQLYQQVESLVPHWMPAYMKDDLRQELVLLVLENGTASKQDVAAWCRRYVPRVERSMDSRLPSGDTLHDFISDPRSFDPSD